MNSMLATLLALLSSLRVYRLRAIKKSLKKSDAADAGKYSSYEVLHN